MIQIFDDDIDPKLQILDFCVKMQFLTAIDVVIAVLEVKIENVIDWGMPEQSMVR